MGNLKTQEEFENEIHEKYPYIKIRGKYIGTDKPINCICEIDDYEWNPRAYNLSKNGCPCCNGNRTTLKSFKNELKETHPEVILLNNDLNVIDLHTKLNCRCSICGLEFNKELIAIRKWGCARCNTNYHNSRGLKQKEYCRKIFDLYGDDITVLGKYKTNNIKILHRCNIHNYEWNTLPRTLLSGINSCKFCSGRMKSNGKKRTLEDLKDKIKLIYGNEYEVLDDEYIDGNHKMNFMHHPKNDKSHKVISYPGRILHVKSGCPVCAGLQISKGYNDISTTDPEIASWFVNKEQTYMCSKSSNKKVDFKCPSCGNIVHKSINQVSRDRDIRCPVCKDGISYPNKFIFNSLLQIKDKLDFLDREYNPNWCKFNLKGKKRKGVYDIYFGINNKQYIIEMDGGFHEKLHSKEKYCTLEDIKYIDCMKDTLATEHNIEMIRIDCIYENHDRYDYILNNILNSKLSEILPLNQIDFDEANRKSQKSLLVEACNLWNEGFTAHGIMEKLHISKCMVAPYLNSGKKYGLCDYSSLESIHRSTGVKVVCVNTKQIFDTIIEAGKFYNIDTTGIKYCCDGNAFSAGKHKETKERLFWVYYEDYKNMTDDDIQKYLLDEYKFADENNLFGRKVVCTTTKIVFISVMSASRYYKICETGIRKCCKSEIETSGKLDDGTKLKWMYYDDYSRLYGESNLINQGYFH